MNPDEFVAALERERLIGMPRWNIWPEPTGDSRANKERRRREIYLEELQRRGAA